MLLYIFIQSRSGGDFRIFIGASKLLFEGKNCYNVWIQLTKDNFCGYSYSPFFAILLMPLAYLPFRLPELIWLLFDVFFLYRIFIITKEYINTFPIKSKQFNLWILLIILINIRFVMHNFEMIQMTIFLVFVCLESIRFVQDKKYLKGSLLLALGSIIKILPIVFIIYLIYRRYYKAAAFSVIFIVLFIFFPVIIYGWDFNTILLNDWWHIINPMNKDFTTAQNLWGEGIFSLSGWVPAFFLKTKNYFNITYNRVVIDLGVQYIPLALNFLRVLFVVFTLYFLRTRPFKKTTDKQHIYWELSYIMLIIPLIFPHERKYSFFFLFPATAYIIQFLLVAKASDFAIFSKLKFYFSGVLLVIYFILTSATSAGLINHSLSDLCDFYKLITFGTFLLVLVLAMCKPMKNMGLGFSE